MAKQKFKKFMKSEKMKKRSDQKRGLVKAAGIGRRRSNRDDSTTSHQSRATMENLLGQVKQGGVSVSMSDDLDPRALTNLFIEKGTTAAVTQKQKQVKQAVEDTKKDQVLQEDEVPTTMRYKEELLEKQHLKAPQFRLKASTEGLIPKALELDAPGQEEAEGDDGKKESKNFYAKEGGDWKFWEKNKVHQRLRMALKDMNFTHPTPIQAEVLPTALANPLTHDIVVASETGSGKTMVFALPIIQSVLRGSNSMNDPAGVYASKSTKKTTKRDRDWLEGTGANDGDEKVSDVLHTLIISPTRELAQQIAKAMEQLGKFTDKSMLRIGCLVGGMAQHKQQRILNRHPHVLIATPGRIWDLVAKNEGCFLGHSISKRLSFLVLDEADRLLDSGRFEQLKLILERIHSDMLPTGRFGGDMTYTHKDYDGDEIDSDEGEGGPCEWNEEKQEFVPLKQPAREEDGRNAEGAIKAKDQPRPMNVPPPPHNKHRVITFVTSATLSLEVNYSKRDIKGSRTIIRTNNANTMGQVLSALSIKPSHAMRFEMKPEHGTTGQLHETYLRCPEKAKDLYLYYFLKTYRGDRTVIFVNAISMLRRLTKLIAILGVPCCGLHAGMQQRQRLQYIDKFKSGETKVLIATDVAARGLDVEGVKYVVHFQLPRSTDGYIHRCGRTARCGGTGFSLAMVDAKEYAAFQKLLASMGRTDPLEVFAIDPITVHHLHPHLQLAMQIDKLTHEMSKDTAKNHWVRSNADSMDLDVDEMIKSDLLNENRGKSKALKILKKRLDTMTKRDLDIGHKGSFRSAPKALGAIDAGKKLKDRADRQVYMSDQRDE